jgi:hypothetical protein
MFEYKPGELLESRTETTLRFHATTGHVVDGFLLVRTLQELASGDLGRMWPASDLRIPAELQRPAATLL